MTEKFKNFDAVAFQRKVRKQMSKDMKNMTFAQRQEYIQKKASITLARIAKFNL